MTRGNTIRTFALICVAVTTAFIIYMRVWETNILSGDGWCARAIGASNAAESRPEFAVKGCYDLMQAQVDALALNSHMDTGVIGLCLAVLVVIVVAGGRLAFRAGADGVSGDIGREEAADRVAEAAVEEAEEVKAGE
tara:strand:- start:8968 stop:9378 length:411 start_codon:yes stop_codon:yes gene_type:complete